MSIESIKVAMENADKNFRRTHWTVKAAGILTTMALAACGARAINSPDTNGSQNSEPQGSGEALPTLDPVSKEVSESFLKAFPEYKDRTGMTAIRITGESPKIEDQVDNVNSSPAFNPTQTEIPPVVISPTETLVIDLTNTPTSEPSATATDVVKPTEVFKPMELGTLKKPAKCTIEDFNGRIQAQEKKSATPLVAGADDKWGRFSQREKMSVYFFGDPKMISFCTIPNFLGEGRNVDMIGLQIPTPDGSIRVIHLASDSALRYQISKIQTFGIIRALDPETKKILDTKGFQWMSKLFEQEGDSQISHFADINLEGGKGITDEVEKMIFLRSFGVQ